MIVRRDFSSQEEKVSVVLTIGFFDGVHLGHQKIISEVIRRAKLIGAKSCVITFDQHPSQLFSGKKIKLLTSQEEKEEIFCSLGIDILQIFTFTDQFARLSPERFLQELSKIFTVKEIFVGEEFAFGFKREGNITFLDKNQIRFGYKFKAISPVRLNGEKISSSFLREWLKNGEIKKVTKGLGRPPTIIGRVVPGKGRGREIGYPTANLEPHPQKLLPESGVYAGYGKLEGNIYRALVNIGAKPTFGDFTSSVEVHMIGLNRVLYGEMIKIALIEKIRDTYTFPSPLHLSRQIGKDREKAERILDEHKNYLKGKI